MKEEERHPFQEYSDNYLAEDLARLERVKDDCVEAIYLIKQEQARRHIAKKPA